jgi:hypothetical protein
LRYLNLHVTVANGAVTTDVPADTEDAALQCVDLHMRTWHLDGPAELVVQLGIVPAVDARDAFLAQSYVDALQAMCDAVPDDGKVRDRTEIAALVERASRRHHDDAAIKLWARAQTMNPGERAILMPYMLARAGIRSCASMPMKP